MTSELKAVAYILISLAPMLAAARSKPVDGNPAAAINTMLEADKGRRAAMQGYSALREYSLSVGHRNAAMLVRIHCAADGTKSFDVLSEAGSRALRTLVLHRMLKAEIEASRPETQGQARITPLNYKFHFVDIEMVSGRRAYVFDITPRQHKKFLVRGRIWIDAADYAVVRVEGSPARNPSFWIHSAHIVYTYAKEGPFWLPAVTDSSSKVRIFGRAQLTIRTYRYQTEAAHKKPALGALEVAEGVR